MPREIRVLHVDDSPEFAELTATYLERVDDRFTVETATDGEDALDRMEELIDDLLTVAHEGDLVSDIEAVSLRASAERSWATVETADATLDVQTDAVVRPDDTALQQLFENLFSNVVTHAGRDARIVVADHPGGFAVADDGPGIPPRIERRSSRRRTRRSRRGTDSASRSSGRWSPATAGRSRSRRVTRVARGSCSPVWITRRDGHMTRRRERESDGFGSLCPCDPSCRHWSSPGELSGRCGTLWSQSSPHLPDC